MDGFHMSLLALVCPLCRMLPDGLAVHLQDLASLSNGAVLPVHIQKDVSLLSAAQICFPLKIINCRDDKRYPILQFSATNPLFSRAIFFLGVAESCSRSNVDANCSASLGRALRALCTACRFACGVLLSGSDVFVDTGWCVSFCFAASAFSFTADLFSPSPLTRLRLLAKSAHRDPHTPFTNFCLYLGFEGRPKNQISCQRRLLTSCLARRHLLQDGAEQIVRRQLHRCQLLGREYDRRCWQQRRSTLVRRRLMKGRRGR